MIDSTKINLSTAYDYMHDYLTNCGVSESEIANHWNLSMAARELRETAIDNDLESFDQIDPDNFESILLDIVHE